MDMTLASANSAAPSRMTVALLVSFAALVPLAIDMFLPGAPIVVRDLQASPQTATAMVSVFFFGLAIGQVFVGPLSDRVGRRPPIIIGLSVFLIGSLIAATASAAGTLLAGRLLQALGASAVMVTGRAVVRDLFDERGSARFFSLIVLIGGLAPILAPVAGAGLLALAGWRAIFLVLALVAAASLAGAVHILRESRSAETEAQARASHPAQAYLTLLRNRRLNGYFLAGALNGGCFFTYLANAPLILMNVYGFNASMFSLIVAINAIGLVGGAQLNRVLLRTRSPSEILSVCAVFAAGLALLFVIFAATLLGGLPAFMALIFIVVASTSLVQANTMAGALSIDPTRAGAAAALFGALSFGAGTGLSLLAGALFDGTPRGTMAVIAISLIGNAAALRFLALPTNDEAQR
jgi:DHA1 family bicyclomycin/chloramphenicol resistance-like MFS transporter